MIGIRTRPPPSLSLLDHHSHVTPPPRTMSSVMFTLLVVILVLQCVQVIRMDGRLLDNNDNHFPTATTHQSLLRRPTTMAEPESEIKQESFSACLMWMDDNAHLSEWLAYHYQTLPLRRLIVAVDPRSQTSPTALLKQWHTLIKITEWSEVDFMPPTLMDKHLHVPQNDHVALTKLFRQRQEEFYTRCMARLKYEGKTWVALVDTDEYISANQHSKQHDAYLKEKTTTTTTTILDLLQAQKHATTDPDSQHNLAQAQETKLAQRIESTPCFPMARLTFGVKESLAEEISSKVPWGFDATRFQTLRWRWHAGRSKKSINKISKSLMDVSRVDSSLFVPTTQVMVHLPIQEYCHGEDDLWLLNSHSLLVVHHYAATWEEWSRRDDTRGKRTRQVYEQLKYDKEADDTIRPWLSEFVQQVGWWTAKQLLP